jgi:hypothetical protein
MAEKHLYLLGAGMKKLVAGNWAKARGHLGGY